MRLISVTYRVGDYVGHLERGEVLQRGQSVVGGHLLSVVGDVEVQRHLVHFLAAAVNVQHLQQSNGHGC